MLKYEKILTLSVAAVFMGLAGQCLAMPGDLFPDVPYENVVDTPRISSKPVTSTPVRPVTPPSVTVPTNPNPTTPNTGSSGSGTVKVTDPSTPSTGTPTTPVVAEGKRKPVHFWSPYADSLLVPLLTPEMKVTFEGNYAVAIANAKTPEDKKKLADTLTNAAAADKSPDGAMKRYLLLQALSLAIDGKAMPVVRESLANQLLPMMENDQRLSVTQAKADALDSLTESANGTASAKLLDLVVDSHTDLAMSQVQVGYPAQASESIRSARAWLAKIARPQAERVAQIYYAQYWLTRSETAKTIAPRLAANLATKPDEPATNTSLATLHLSLYADLENAAKCAAKSDRPTFKSFAKLVGPMDLSKIAITDESGVNSSLEICHSLLNLTVDCTDSFDRYAIASYVESQLSELQEKGKLTASIRSEEVALAAQAQAIIDKNKPALPSEILQQLAQNNAPAQNPQNPTGNQTTDNRNNGNNNNQNNAMQNYNNMRRSFGSFGRRGRG